jgi:hypothetical protein
MCVNCGRPFESNGPCFAVYIHNYVKENCDNLFYMDSTYYTDRPECWSLIATRNLSLASSGRFRDALEDWDANQRIF